MALYKSWRLYTTATGGDNYLSIRNVALTFESNGFNVGILNNPGDLDGYTFFSNGTDAASDEFYAFDDTFETVWESTIGMPKYIGFIGDTPMIAEGLLIYRGGLDSETRLPKDFQVQASNDTTDGTDGTWVTIHTVVNRTTYSYGWNTIDMPLPGEIKFHRVNTLPAGPTYDPSAMYMVKGVNAGEVDMYFTNVDGTDIRHLITHAEVDTKISNALAAYSSMVSVADISARDALSLTADGLVLVADASADATVTSGAAMYFYDIDATSWTKMYEFENMDLVLSWANLADKPNSSVAAIDQAVIDNHTHSNSSVLNAIAEDGTTSNLTFNSRELSGNPEAVTVEW